MQSRIMRRMALAGFAAIAPIAVLACEDDDDDISTSTVEREGTTIVVETATVAGQQAPDAEYQDYVDQICEAGATFRDEMETYVSADFARRLAEDTDNAFDEVSDTFATFGAQLDDADPPAEVESWHDELAERVDAAEAMLRSRDLSQINTVLSTDFPELPSGARAQLEAAAEGNDDCDAAGLF